MSSPIRGLSEQEIDDLTNGRGMGLARAAELNGYPGPLHVLRRRWLSILVGALVGLLASLAYVQSAQVTYEARASVFFSLVSGNSASDLVQGSTYAQNQVESFAELARTGDHEPPW